MGEKRLNPNPFLHLLLRREAHMRAKMADRKKNKQLHHPSRWTPIYFFFVDGKDGRKKLRGWKKKKKKRPVKPRPVDRLSRRPPREWAETWFNLCSFAHWSTQRPSPSWQANRVGRKKRDGGAGGDEKHMQIKIQFFFFQIWIRGTKGVEGIIPTVFLLHPFSFTHKTFDWKQKWPFFSSSSSSLAYCTRFRHSDNIKKKKRNTLPKYVKKNKK